MALPAIAIGATRALKGVKGVKKLLGGLMGGGSKERPRLNSGEGLLMLTIAGLFDLINIILGILDFVGVGLVLSPIINTIPTAFIGGWLWFRTGSFPLKKGLGSFGLNSVPGAKFIPWWFISVWTTLEK